MILLSKSQIKLITSLQQKKYRVKSGLFVAEGKKLIQDLLSQGVTLQALYATLENDFEEDVLQIISSTELNKISFLKTANTCLALFEIPRHINSEKKGLTIVLDSVNDPGNLGTIIRLCDWFGVEQIICSENTVDCYNPKVVQATMGSIARVKVQYLDILKFLKASKFPIYGACMDGNNSYKQKLPENAILIMGNEARGISTEIMDLLDHKITIPKFGALQKAESLNVAMATGILLSEFKRNLV